MPTVLDLMAIWIKFALSGPFCSLILKMMFTLTISCLTTSNLPWFMDLPFSVPMQCCSLQYWTSIPSHIHNWALFCFGSASSFFWELFLHPTPVVYWIPSNLGSSSFSVLLLCLFILFMGFSRQEHWGGLSFPSPGNHVLSGYYLK